MLYIFWIELAQSLTWVANEQACFICKQRVDWRCVRCSIASHDKCAAWPDEVIYLKDRPGKAVCWRHPTDWREDRKVNFFFPSSVISSHVYPCISSWVLHHTWHTVYLLILMSCKIYGVHMRILFMTCIIMQLSQRLRGHASCLLVCLKWVVTFILRVASEVYLKKKLDLK